MRRIDLHTHSNQSDGSMSPAELVDHAVEKGLCAIALTDHDTTEGVAQAAARAAWHTAQGRPIALIPGIEFSAEYEERDIHIVGLAIDKDSPGLQERLSAFSESRNQRNIEMCQKLREAGVEITYEALKKEYPDSIITRSHFARFLMGHGYVDSVNDAFRLYIGEQCPCYVPRKRMTPQRAVERIRQAKGIPVLAHPMQYQMDEERLEKLCLTLKESGLAALEAIYCTHTAIEEEMLRNLAKKCGLGISGGSDFHGKAKPGLELGTGYGDLCVPEEIWLNLQETYLKGRTS